MLNVSSKSTATKLQEEIDYYDSISDGIKIAYERSIVNVIEDSETDMNIEFINQIFNILNMAAMDEFIAVKRADDEVWRKCYTKFAGDLKDYRNFIDDKVFLFELYIVAYNQSMENAIHEKQPYFTKDQLLECHQRIKGLIVEEFGQKFRFSDDIFTFAFIRRIEREIDSNFPTFEQQNDEKRRVYFNEIDDFDEKLINEVAQTFDEFMESNYSRPFMTENEYRNSFNIADTMIYHEFNSRKLGDDEVIRTHSQKLDKKVLELHSKWRDINDSRRRDYFLVESSKVGLFSMLGALVGGILGGPIFAVGGALLAGTGRSAFSWLSFDVLKSKADESSAKSEDKL